MPRGQDGQNHLVRICDEDGRVNRSPSEKGKRSRVIQRGCHICKQYIYKPQNTQWKCVDCNMPLCQVYRSDGNNLRDCDCYTEHKSSEDREIGCFPNMCRETWIMPQSHLKYMLSRAQYEEKEKRNGKRKAARSDDSREVVRVSPDKRHRRRGGR